MVYKSSSIPLLINLILIVLTACPLLYLAAGPHYYFTAWLIPLLLIEVLAVLRQINNTNRSISYFFEEIEMDEKLITQVVINLVNNAVDAVNENETDGKIIFKVSRGELNRPQIHVTNNGNPIPEDIMDKIFIPFFTTKEKGSGIGLSLSRQIIRQHGGQLYIESGNDTTTFIIEL